MLSDMGRWGFLSAVKAALVWRLRQWCGLRLYGIYTRELGVSSPDSADISDYTHRVFEPRDEQGLRPLAGDPRLSLSEDFMHDAFAKGDACDAIFCGDKLVSYTWMAFTPTHDEDGVHVDFGPRYRYAYKAFTLPEFRGRHAIRQFKAASDAYCVQHGRTSTIAFIAIDNHPSIRYALGVGNRRIGFAGYLKLGGLFFSFRTPGVRKEGFRFFRPDARARQAAPAR